MTTPASLEDGSSPQIAIAQAYADGQGKFVANQSSPYTHADGTFESGGVVVLPAPTTLGLPVITPSIRQKASGSTGSGAKTLAVAFPNNIADGNSVIVVLGMGEVETGGGSPITLAITDSQSLTYTQAGKGTQSTTLEAAIFYATDTQFGANTVTATIAGSGSSNTAISMEIYEVEGLITVASLIVDQTANNSNAGSTAVSTANITPNYANEIAFMAVAAGGGTITAGPGWNLDSGSLAPTGGNLVSFASLSRFQMTQGALVPTATLGASNAWAACAVVFRAMHVQQEGVHVIQGGFTELGSLSAGSSNADIINMDVSNYKWLSFHINGNAYSGTLTPQGSNDNVNWVGVEMHRADTASAGNSSSAIFGTNNIYVVPITFRYFRLRMTSYTSGAAQGTVELYTYPPSFLLQSIAISNNPSVTQSGAWTVGLSNGNITVFSSAAYTTTQTQSDQTNTAARGIRVVLDMTNVGAGPSVTLEIDAKDAVSGKYVPLLTGAAVTTVSTNVYEVYPGLTPAANAVVSDVLPTTWRVKVVANNSNSGTYSVGASYLL